jgi:hypothetical protein
MAGNPTNIPTDLIVGGNLSASSISISAGSVSDASIAANAKIASSKTVAQKTISLQLNGPTTTVTTQTQWITSIKGLTGTLIDVNAFIAVAAAGAATVTIDLQKSTSAGVFATVLSSTISISNATVIRTAVPGTITSAPVVAGDIFQLVVTATAGGGTLPQGLLVTLRHDETYV